MNESSRVKVALVGAGRWGLQHARMLSENPRVDFCALVGRSAEKTQLRADAFGVRAYLDIHEMLDRERPDLVNLCLPNQGHFEPTLQVIRAGYPLFVEKPLAFDLNEADLLLKEAGERKLFFAINFNHRYAVPVQKLDRAIREGRLGEIVFATWRFGGSAPGERMLDNIDPEARRREHPYGNLIETQCHGFDMLEFLCGPIQSVMAELTNVTGGGYRTMALSLKFANGAVGSMLGTYDSSYDFKYTHFMEVNGTSGRATVEDTVRRYSYQAARSETAEVWEAGYFNTPDHDFYKTFDKHFDAVLQAFQKREPPPVPAERGRRALALALAAIQSFESGHRVAV